MKFYAWDEGTELEERNPVEMMLRNAENGAITESFYTEQGFVDVEEGIVPVNPKWVVEIRSFGRMIGLETWAETKEEAHRRFLLNKVYKDYMEEDQDR
jgi:hypothetical protein